MTWWKRVISNKCYSVQWEYWPCVKYIVTNRIRNIHALIPQSRYYNLGKEKEEKCLVQTRSQAKSSCIGLPEVHGVEKGLDPNILLENKL